MARKMCSRSRSRVTQERRELLRSRGARVASPTHDALKRLFANSLGKHISNESSSEAARKLCQQRLIEHCMTRRSGVAENAHLNANSRFDLAFLEISHFPFSSSSPLVRRLQQQNSERC